MLKTIYDDTNNTSVRGPEGITIVQLFLGIYFYRELPMVSAKYMRLGYMMATKYIQYFIHLL